MFGSLRALSVRYKLVGKYRACGSVLRIEHVSVKRGQLDRRVERRRRRSANKQGSRHPSGCHLLADLLHLVKRRSDQPADPDKVRRALRRLLQNRLLRHHHPKIHDLEPIAVQDNLRDVLPDVVHVPLDGSEHNQRLSNFRLSASFLNVRLQQRHRILHGLRRLHHLRQEHLSRPEQFPDPSHPAHQRPVNNLHRFIVL